MALIDLKEGNKLSMDKITKVISISTKLMKIYQQIKSIYLQLQNNVQVQGSAVFLALELKMRKTLFLSFIFRLFHNKMKSVFYCKKKMCHGYKIINTKIY